MCNPDVWYMAAGGVNAVANIDAGREMQSTANANAAMMDIESRDALNRGVNSEQQYTREVRQIQGTQRAVAGANNVTQSGSVLDIENDTASIAGEDVGTIRNNAAREAFGYKAQGSELRRQGRTLKRNAIVRAGGSLLTAGAQTYGYWESQK